MTADEVRDLAALMPCEHEARCLDGCGLLQRSSWFRTVDAAASWHNTATGHDVEVIQ